MRDKIYKMVTHKQLRCGDRLPTGWGIAWDDLSTRQVVIMPLGLNWIAAFFREFYYRLGSGPQTSLVTQLESDIKERLLKDHAYGYESGYVDGKAVGFEDGQKMFLASIDSISRFK